jgi:LemA protein
MFALLAAAGAFVLVALAAIVLYNRLIRLRNGCDNAWSDIDVQLKRRHDLIPNLVETVRGYATHERTVFEEVTEARGRARAADEPAARADAEQALGRAITRLFAVVEAYPELRASEGFRKLQSELAAVEHDIQNARRYYNAIVRDLNTAVETIPSNVVAAGAGIGRRPYFQLDSRDEAAAPRVDLAR